MISAGRVGKRRFSAISASILSVLGMFFHSFSVCFLAPPRAESEKANTSDLMTLSINFDVFARSTCCRNLQNVCQNRYRSESGAEVSFSLQKGSNLARFWELFDSENRCVRVFCVGSSPEALKRAKKEDGQSRETPTGDWADPPETPVRS